MQEIKIFLASSNELKSDREAFELEISRKSKIWQDQGLRLNLELWENITGKVMPRGLQAHYNQVIRACDLFVLLAYTKVGEYTEEEFDAAYDQFQKTGKPDIHIYFKEVVSPSKPERSLEDFQQKLKRINHYYPTYSNFENLWNRFDKELERVISKNLQPTSPSVSEAVMQQEVKNKIRQLVAKGKLADALALLPPNDHDVVMLKNRYEKLKHDTMLGLLSYDNEGRDYAKITRSLLSLLDQIEVGNVGHSASTKNQVVNRTVTQQGEKSVYIENNSGSIHIQ